MLKLGAGAVVLGTASLVGWVGLAVRLADSGYGHPPMSLMDVSVMSFGTLAVTAIAGLLAWVMMDQSGAEQRSDG
jgi:hypothetical protein